MLGRILAIASPSLVLAAGCSPPPTIVLSPAPSAAEPVTVEPTAAGPAADVPGEEPACPGVQGPLCEAYLRVEADCFKRAPPGKSRAILHRDRVRLCDAVQGDPSKSGVSCASALADLVDEPACVAQALTEGFPSALPHPLGSRLASWCAAPPHFEPDPAGLVELSVRSEMASLRPIRAVVIAVDGAPLIVRAMGPNEKTNGNKDGVLGSVRGQLDPGQHKVTWFVLLRPRPDDLGPVFPTRSASCITVKPGAPLAATLVLYDPREAGGLFAPSYATRLDVR